MQEHIQTPMSGFTVGAICTTFAVLCGWVKYATEVHAGVQFSWSMFLTKGAVSGVFGLIGWGLMSLYPLPEAAEGAICGMCGWAGTGVAVLIRAAVLKHLGLTRDDVRED